MDEIRNRWAPVDNSEEVFDWVNDEKSNASIEELKGNKIAQYIVLSHAFILAQEAIDNNITVKEEIMKAEMKNVEGYVVQIAEHMRNNSFW